MKFTRRKRIAFTVSLFVLTLILVFLIRHHTTHTDATATEDTKLVKVLSLKPQSFPIRDKTSGYLQAVEDTTITPRESGYVKAILCQAGQTVTKDQVLFQLDNDKEIEAVQAAVAASKLSTFEFNRNKMLLKKGFITQDLYYQTKVTMQRDQAQLKSAQTDLNNKTITAPFNGTIGTISASIGNYINAGTALTHLVNTKSLLINYTLPAKDFSALKLNQPVKIQDNDGTQSATAYVSFIAPSIDPDTQTITLNAHLINSKNQFKPGEFVLVSQLVKTDPNALLVPEQSVIGALDSYSVFVVKDNQAHEIPVKIGDHEHGYVAILDGLHPNDSVIVAGQNEVRDGEQVRIL